MQTARQKAADFRNRYGYECPVDYLAKVLADQFQARRRHAGRGRGPRAPVARPRLLR